MPEEFPNVAPLQLAVLFKSVAQLGGDLYDFIEFDDGRVAIVIGDVAGKGAPAALYGALSSGVIRTRAGRKYPPAQMLELVNKTLHQRPVEGQYVAVTYAIYEPKTRAISLANSGLPYPLLVRSGQPTYLDIAGVPLGLFPESKYEETSLQLIAGDILVFYSDGVIEMLNDAGEEYGLKRLAEVVRLHCEKSADEIVKAVSASLAEFIGRIRPHDDRTMIVAKMGS